MIGLGPRGLCERSAVMIPLSCLDSLPFSEVTQGVAIPHLV